MRGLDVESHILAIQRVLGSPLASTLLRTHPNDLASSSSFNVPAEWEEWWAWAVGGSNAPYPADESKPLNGEPKWLMLVREYIAPSRDTGHITSTSTGSCACGNELHEPADPNRRPFACGSCNHDGTDTIPPALKKLICDIKALQLDRTPINININSIAGPSAPAVAPSRSQSPLDGQPEGRGRAHGQDASTYGMSPKKSHEVARMRDFIASLLASSASLAAVRHVVDIGAGQGYLSRALRDNLGLHVLALDANAEQTAGAERRVAALEKHRHKHDKAKKKTREQMRPSAGGETVDEQDGMANAAEEEGATSSSAPSVHGSITHRTVPVTSSSGTQSESEPDGLRLVVDDWIAETPPCRQESSYEQLPHAPASAPVLFVALHACGSLTPAILHSFLSWCAPRSGGGKPEGSDHTTGLTSPNWVPAAFLVVGCCYNLLQPQDFPLSSLLRTHTAHHTTPLLPYAALHLAAQVPTHWLATPATRASAELAIRKVVYRALLQPLLREAQEAHGGHSWGESGAGSEEKVDPPSSSLPGVKFGGGMDLDSDALRGTGETPANRRLGRLPDAAYASWAAFLAQASQRTGFHFCPSRPSHNPDIPPHPEYGALAVLHVLRCLLGPLAESLLIMDRLQWLREQAAVRGSRLDVERVNLFDQATGSGRNVALLGVLRE